MLDLNILRKQIPNVEFREIRIGVYKILIPFFHEDGDMYDVFIEEDGGFLRLSDYGLTLMKLSYAFEIDSPHKQEVLENIIDQNRCKIDTGNIYLDIKPEQFSFAIYQFIQAISKVSVMDTTMSVDYVKSYFYENFDKFIKEAFKNIETKVSPIKGLIVDYVIPSEKPIYVFPVLGDTRASKVVITCLRFIEKKLSHRSLVVHENFEGLSKFYRNQLTDTVDKQFTSLKVFSEQGSDYVKRLIS